MEKIILENKPLIEAIFEVRWSLTEVMPNINVDPAYKILIGRFFDKINKDYPFHEPIDSVRTAAIRVRVYVP